ncbi:MAG TPA: NrsF family protein [Bryobacteraceae bacterium]|nr:NrsF family protein [Bryobacteraceae bacterium]
MMDGDVDDILKRAASAPHEVDREAIKRASDLILPALKPVRPLPSTGVVALTLQVIFVVVAILGATALGNNGIRVLNKLQALLIFAALGVSARLASVAAASEMVPAHPKRIAPPVLLAGATGLFVLVFGVLFYDYRLDRFVREGLSCVGAGLVYAGMAGLLIWLVLRRGYILDPAAAGLAAGTLAGLTGLGMLELHCPILKSLHLMVWHTAVIPLSALGGYLAGRMVHDLGIKRKAAEFMQ